MTALKIFLIMMKELKQKSNKILLKNNPASSVNFQDLLHIISEQISWSQRLTKTTVFLEASQNTPNLTSPKALPIPTKMLVDIINNQGIRVKFSFT